MLKNCPGNTGRGAVMASTGAPRVPDAKYARSVGGSTAVSARRPKIVRISDGRSDKSCGHRGASGINSGAVRGPVRSGEKGAGTRPALRAGLAGQRTLGRLRLP